MQIDIGEGVRKRGWRQGTIVPVEQILEALPDGSPIAEADFAMVVSQSCDLVHHDLRNEPTAVVLLLKSLNSGISEQLMHGRNPRHLHFQSLDGRWFEAWAWNQATIPRQELARKDASTEIGLSPKVLRCVLDWLAKRFTRIAFPDSFNTVLKPKSNAIEKLIKKNHHLFSEILMRISPFDELETNQHYEVACFLLMEAEVYQDPKQLDDARVTAGKLEMLFEDCGIAVHECSAVSEEHLTVAEFNNLLNWDFEHLTNRASPDS